MICTVIQKKTLEEIGSILENVEMAEIRLDSCVLSLEDIDECFQSDVPLVATCRIAEIMAANPEMNEIKAAAFCEKKLCRAIEAGARYVDVEIEAPKSMSKRVRACARDNGTVFIRSYHDFSGTDSSEALKALVEKCLYHGADVAKIVTTAHSQEDVDRVMNLYDEFPPEKLIAFCMGDAGSVSRIDCLKRGAVYSYAALSENDMSALGQLPVQKMSEAVYGGRQFIGGKVKVPSSKSFAQRAILAAALAEGESHLEKYTPCGDNEAAIALARTLGAEINVSGDMVSVKGTGAFPGCMDARELNVGESGLLCRLAMPLASQLSVSDTSISGEGSLLLRRMTGAEEMLAQFGVQISADSVPLTVSGRLRSGRAEISGANGSQLISGLLMALPLGEKNSSVIVDRPKSIPYMFITLDVLKKFGIRINNEMLGGRDFLESDGDWSLCSEMVFKVKGGQRYSCADFAIEGDWSAAANFLVAGAVFGKVEIEGLDTTSLQADISIMDILMDAGASLSQMDGNDGPVTAQRAPLTAFEVDASNCPDLFPIVSVFAAFCQGTSRITGVDRLLHKECDRAGAIVEMLDRMGVNVKIDGNDLVIEGESLCSRILSGRLLKGGRYSSHSDHRMAMALSVAGLGAESPIEIDDKDCVAKSYPEFFNIFDRLIF